MKKMKVVVGILLVSNLISLWLLVRILTAHTKRDHYAIILNESVKSPDGDVVITDGVMLIPAEGDDFRFSDLGDHRLYKLYVRIPDGANTIAIIDRNSTVPDGYKGPVIDVQKN